MSQIDGQRVSWSTPVVIGAIVGAIVLVIGAYQYLEARFASLSEGIAAIELRIARDYVERDEVDSLRVLVDDLRMDVVRIYEKLDAGSP